MSSSLCHWDNDWSSGGRNVKEGKKEGNGLHGNGAFTACVHTCILKASLWISSEIRCSIPHSCVLILVLTNFLFLKRIHPDGGLNRKNFWDLNWTVVSLNSISSSFCDEEALPPLLLSLAYPGAYPLEKMDELVKAVWGKEEARASSHFSAGRGGGGGRERIN